MDVMLVNPNINEGTRHSHLSLPLGLAYLGSVLCGADYDVSAIDLNITPMDTAQIAQYIKKTSPLILAISALTPNYLKGLTIARLAKYINPEIKVVIGGPHASVLYKEVVKEQCVDVVVRGEGEYTMLELTDCLIKKRGDLATIKGIVYKDSGAIKVTDKRPPITDPDKLPFPARHLFPFNLYGYPNAVLTSRGGCPFACPFCAVNNIWGRNRHPRRPEKVVEEILSIVDPTKEVGRYVNFSDDAFSLDRERTMQLCHLMQQSLKSHQILQWRCATRVDLVDAGLIWEMRNAGCYQIQYGIESGSQKILDSISKKIDLDQIRKAVHLTLNSGIKTACFFMFPFPEDTEQTVKEQIRFMKELSLMGANVTLSMTTPYPGTYFYNNAERLGIKILSKNWEEYDATHLIIATKNLSKEKLQDFFQEMCEESCF